MKRRIPFSEEEMRIVDALPGMFGFPDTPVRNLPVSSRENLQALFYERTPYWIPGPFDSIMFSDPLYLGKLGRGSGADSVDAFGLEWVWVEQTGGSIVRPGAPRFDDANEWEDNIVFPDLDSWDWAKVAEENPINMKHSCTVSLVNGFWFERLISFMDFENAAIALIDDSQTDAVTRFFTAMTDLGCAVVDKYCQFYPGIDIINVHDDWGSQQNAFFSEEVARELFLPHMKRIVNHIHSKGRLATLHSCGHVDNRIHLFVEAGWDAWEPQTMNDTKRLYDEWGDQIVVTVHPDPMTPDTPEDVQRQKAREFVDYYANPGKPVMYAGFLMPQTFNDEVYACSRKRFYEL
jgi:hypothetical protein